MHGLAILPEIWIIREELNGLSQISFSLEPTGKHEILNPDVVDEISYIAREAEEMKGQYIWSVRGTDSVLSGLLLLSFATGMVTGLGIKAPFDYSVFSAAAAAFLLALWEPDRFTLDKLLDRLRN